MIKAGDNKRDGKIREVEVKPSTFSKPIENKVKRILAIDYYKPFSAMYQFCDSCKRPSSHRKYPDMIVCLDCRMLTNI